MDFFVAATEQNVLTCFAMVTAMKDGKRDEARALSQQLRATKDEPDMLAQDLCDE